MKLNKKLRSMYGGWNKKLTHRRTLSMMHRCKVRISLNLSLNLSLKRQRQRKNRNNNLWIKKWRKRQHKTYIIERFLTLNFTISF